MTITQSTLSNGMRVVTDRIETVESASLGIWVGVGARHEHEDVNGVAHMLEHMAFKGTKRRSARSIAEEIEQVGGSLNAYTSRENTAYFARVLKADVPLAIDILADILQNSTFDSEELTRERAVVIQEIGQSFDSPEDLVFDHFQEVSYPDQPLGRSILGSADRIGVMSRETIAGYMNGTYTAPGMVLAAAGRVDHDEIVAQAEALLRDLPRGNSPPAAAAAYRGGERIEDRDLEQVHLVLGFDGVAYGDPDYYAVSLLSHLLGGGMSSRLFQEIREKRGLVYSIYSFTAPYMDGGSFGFYAGTGEQEATELIPVLCDEINKVMLGVSHEELERTKAQIKAGILMALESTSARCERLAQHLFLYDRPLTPAEIVAKIDAVDEDAIARAARRVFATKPSFAALGPTTGLRRLPPIASRFA